VTTAVVGDFRIGKEGSTATLSGATVTHDGNGYYRIALTTGNTDTVGRLTIYSGNTAHSMGVRALMVLLPSVYDALVANATNSTGGLPTATGAITGLAGAIPTLAQIEASTILAKESTVQTRATQASVDIKPTLAQIEASTILAKEATAASILSAVQGLNNLSAKVNVYASPLMEIPESGSLVYAFTVIVRDDEDKLVNLDASPTIAAANAAGTSRSANLSAVSNPATGRYTFTYTVDSTHAAESLRVTISGTVSGEARYSEWIGAVVDYDSLTVLQAIKAKTDNLPALPAAVGDIPTANQNRDAVLNALPSAGYASGSFGDRILISDSNNRTVKVTGAGSGHIAADVHQMQQGVITNVALDSSAATEVANAVAALSVLVDLVTMITGSGTPNAKWTASALSLAPTGGGGGGTGAGARTVTITVLLAGAPVEGARVRLTKAAETYVGSTNVSGQITFNVDDGSWVVGIGSPNATFGGAVLVVSANQTQTYTMTAISITPSGPGGVTGYWLCLGVNGLPESGVTMSMQATAVPHGSTGLAIDTGIRTTTSNGAGVAQFTDLTPGVRYACQRGTGQVVYVTIPEDATGTLELNSLLGAP
jgi:hypothetical protein